MCMYKMPRVVKFSHQEFITPESSFDDQGETTFVPIQPIPNIQLPSSRPPDNDIILASTSEASISDNESGCGSDDLSQDSVQISETQTDHVQLSLHSDSEDTLQDFQDQPQDLLSNLTTPPVTPVIYVNGQLQDNVDAPSGNHPFLQMGAFVGQSFPNPNESYISLMTTGQLNQLVQLPQASPSVPYPVQNIQMSNNSLSPVMQLNQQINQSLPIPSSVPLPIPISDLQYNVQIPSSIQNQMLPLQGGSTGGSFQFNGIADTMPTLDHHHFQDYQENEEPFPNRSIKKSKKKKQKPHKNVSETDASFDAVDQLEEDEQPLTSLVGDKSEKKLKVHVQVSEGDESFNSVDPLEIDEQSLSNFVVKKKKKKKKQKLNKQIPEPVDSLETVEPEERDQQHLNNDAGNKSKRKQKLKQIPEDTIDPSDIIQLPLEGPSFHKSKKKKPKIQQKVSEVHDPLLNKDKPNLVFTSTGKQKQHMNYDVSEPQPSTSTGVQAQEGVMSMVRMFSLDSQESFDSMDSDTDANCELQESFESDLQEIEDKFREGRYRKNNGQKAKMRHDSKPPIPVKPIVIDGKMVHSGGDISYDEQESRIKDSKKHGQEDMKPKQSSARYFSGQNQKDMVAKLDLGRSLKEIHLKPAEQIQQHQNNVNFNKEEEKENKSKHISVQCVKKNNRQIGFQGDTNHDDSPAENERQISSGLKHVQDVKAPEVFTKDMSSDTVSKFLPPGVTLQYASSDGVDQPLPPGVYRQNASSNGVDQVIPPGVCLQHASGNGIDQVLPFEVSTHDKTSDAVDHLLSTGLRRQDNTSGNRHDKPQEKERQYLLAGSSKQDETSENNNLVLAATNSIFDEPKENSKQNTSGENRSQLRLGQGTGVVIASSVRITVEPELETTKPSKEFTAQTVPEECAVDVNLLQPKGNTIQEHPAGGAAGSVPAEPSVPDEKIPEKQGQENICTETVGVSEEAEENITRLSNHENSPSSHSEEINNHAAENCNTDHSETLPVSGNQSDPSFISVMDISHDVETSMECLTGSSRNCAGDHQSNSSSS